MEKMIYDRISQGDSPEQIAWDSGIPLHLVILKFFMKSGAKTRDFVNMVQQTKGKLIYDTLWTSQSIQ